MLGGPAETAPSNVAPDNALLDHATITVDTGNVGFDSNGSGYSTALLKAFLHEIGHTMGLGDNPVNQQQSCGGQTALDSLMNGMCGTNDSAGNMPSSITGCDQGQVFNNYYTGPCPGNDCNEGGSGTQADNCTYPATGCPPGYHNGGGCCQPDVPSPVLIDVDGSGFQLTDAADGVWFDFYGTGQPIKISWMAIGSTNAWLVLDRNGNGTIDNASEMFGNTTTQPNSPDKNGFAALSEFDKTGAGGNEDGRITLADPMFSMLRIWQDTNHNGISEPNELHSLSDVGIATIDCRYKEARRIDQYGNQFRYRAKVLDTHQTQVGRWAWDVFLVTAQ